MIRRLEESVSTLNPICRQTLSDRHVAQYLFTPLIYVNANLVPLPGIARSCSISPDGRVYRFTIDDRATFSDGRKVTTQDVLFTLRRIADPTSMARDADAFADMDDKRTRVLSPSTIEVVFTETHASRLLRFADVLVLPEHVYSRGNFRNDHNNIAIGSGPYILEHRDADRIVLVRRPTYWREVPSIDRVIFRPITDFYVAWRAVKTGVVDESYVPSTAWKSERAGLAQSHRFMHFYTPRFSFVAWNTRHPVLRDVRIRRALAMSFNLEAAVRQTYEGTARALTVPLAPESADYDASVAAMTYAPTDAMRLFAAAGWRRRLPDGPLENRGLPLRLEMLTSAMPTPPLLTAMQDELKKAGVRIDVVTMDNAAVTAKLKTGNYDAAFVDIDFNGDPELYPVFHSSQIFAGGNCAAYSNPEVDQLLARGRTEMDAVRRAALHRRVHAIVAAEQPYSWCVQVAAKWALRSRVAGVTTSPFRGLFLWYPGELGWRISENPSRVHERPDEHKNARPGAPEVSALFRREGRG